MEDLQQYPETCYVKRRRRRKKSNQFHREHTYTPYPCARVGLVFGHNAMRRINPGHPSHNPCSRSETEDTIIQLQ